MGDTESNLGDRRAGAALAGLLRRVAYPKDHAAIPHPSTARGTGEQQFSPVRAHVAGTGL